MRTTLLVTALLASVLPAQGEEFDHTITTTLGKVRAEAEAYKNLKIEFEVQFASLGKISNPFFTQFTPTDYVNFYCWGDDQPIWRKEAYEDLFGMMFVSKLNPNISEVYNLRLYQRLHITGVVRNTFQDTPWIEVLEWTPIGGEVSSAALAHLYRGEQFIAERQWQRAIAELSRAPVGGVPASVTRAVNKNLGICYLRVGETQRAITHLQLANLAADETDFEVSRLLAAATGRPSTELDRTVSTDGLKDYERPMWEAFEQSGNRRL